MEGTYLYRWISKTICIVVRMNKCFINLIVYIMSVSGEISPA